MSATQAHRAYYQQVYPAIWREKLRRYGLTPYCRRMVRFLESRMALWPAPRVLEVASGTGEPFARSLAGRGPFVGVDIAEDLLASAREAVPGGLWVVGDAGTLPFPAGAFDLVYCLQSSWCLEDAGTLVREMTRVAAPAGTCVVDLMNVWSPRVALTHAVMRARNLLRGGLDSYMRERSVDPWRILEGLPAGCRGGLRTALDPDRPASRLRNRFDARLVLVIEKR